MKTHILQPAEVPDTSQPREIVAYELVVVLMLLVVVYAACKTKD